MKQILFFFAAATALVLNLFIDSVARVGAKDATLTTDVITIAGQGTGTCVGKTLTDQSQQV